MSKYRVYRTKISWVIEECVCESDASEEEDPTDPELYDIPVADTIIDSKTFCNLSVDNPLEIEYGIFEFLRLCLTEAEEVHEGELTAPYVGKVTNGQA